MEHFIFLMIRHGVARVKHFAAGSYSGVFKGYNEAYLDRLCYRVLGCTSKLWFKSESLDFFRVALFMRRYAKLYKLQGRLSELKDGRVFFRIDGTKEEKDATIKTTEMFFSLNFRADARLLRMMKANLKANRHYTKELPFDYRGANTIEKLVWLEKYCKKLVEKLEALNEAEQAGQ